MKLLLICFALCVVANSYAQINKIKGEIIQDVGFDYKTDDPYKGQNGVIYSGITYTNQRSSEKCGSFYVNESYTFDDDNICVLVTKVYPLCEANVIIKNMNDKYVKAGELKWKDYTTNTRIEATIIGKTITVQLCAIK